MSPEAVKVWETEQVVLASESARAALLANPKVRDGLMAYFDRHERYAGEIPTVAGEELDRRLATD